jgi:hypothetical protein
LEWLAAFGWLDLLQKFAHPPDGAPFNAHRRLEEPVAFGYGESIEEAQAAAMNMLAGRVQ